MTANTDTNNTSPTPVDADGIPLYTGDGVSPCCWVSTGQAHTLSCDIVTPEMFRNFRANH